jgi:hypothetical protein
MYRNLPEPIDENNNYHQRRTDTYNPSPLTSQRINTSYYSIKSDLDVYQMMTVTKSLIKNIPYFKYENNVYAFKDLKWETLHSTKNRNLEKTEEEIFQERMNNGEDGTHNIKYNDLLSYQQKVLKIMLYYFILKLNLEVRKSGYSLPYHDLTNYFISDYQIIKMEYHQKLNLYKYTLIIEAHRDNKHHGYIFYTETLFKPDKMDVWISKAILRGIQPQDKLAFRHLNSYKKSNFIVGSELNSLEKETNDMKLLKELYDAIRKTELKQLKESKINTDENNSSNNNIDISKEILLRNLDDTGSRKCFKPDDQYWPFSKTSNDCLSYDTTIKKVGIWDKECTQDTDCPFYKANKNYPNTFGGCKNGTCQLPIGMKSIGFKHYTKDKPICYNCHKKIKVMTADGKTIITNRECSGIECNKCCDVQNDKDLYPNLKSPDYAFTNDTDERNKHSQVDEMIIENPQT